MFAQLFSAVVLGVEAKLIEVQCDVANGLPTFQIVGLPEKEISESRERVRSAIRNSGYAFPSKRITANLAPADLRKEGVGFDLPTALGILIASGQLSPVSNRYLITGELSLDSKVCPVDGVLAMVLAAAAAGLDGAILSQSNAVEAALVEGIPIYPVRTLSEAVSFLSGERELDAYAVDRSELLTRVPPLPAITLNAIKGQEQAKRALEIAAGGGHNLLMIGPPGAGKSLLAHAMVGILPPLSFDEALEVTRIYSIAHRLNRNTPLITQRPFRSPHHTISYAGMVGGGHGLPGPGEITLSHHGVLFLDELPEFDRRVLETLRQPLEDRTILLSRAGASVRYPCNFSLVAAMNPCPCGYLGDPLQPCICTLHDLKRYRRRVSGPFLDRIDLFVEVPRLSPEELLNRAKGEEFTAIQGRVARARQIQRKRLKKETTASSNAQLDAKQIGEYCVLVDDARELLKMAIDRFALSARAYTRVLKVARTVADLESQSVIHTEHLAEALQYRSTSKTEF
jgi:magnesium chelatase family protein